MEWHTMPTAVRLRNLFVPASIGLILVLAVGWYNFFWLPSEHRYLDDRDFRVLKTLSEQIRLSIDNFDKMMDNAADSGIKGYMLHEYLSNVAPQLQTPGDEETKSVIGEDYADPPKIAVVSDEGTHLLYMAFQRKKVRYAIRTDLDTLIGKVLPPPSRNPFNIVLVAKRDGTVIFQRSSPGIDVARINTLEDLPEAGTPGKRDKPEKPDPENKSVLQSSRYGEDKLAGAMYRLYAQPLQLSFPSIDRRTRRAEDIPSPAEAEQWVLWGLVRADAFRSESQSISYTYILWLSAAILLAVCAYPFLKLQVLRHVDLLRSC